MNLQLFSKKSFLSFGLFSLVLMAQAQSQSQTQSQSSILLEACNSFKNVAKRSECLKTVQGKTNQLQAQPTLKPTAETPLSIDGAAAICEKVFTSLVSRHAEATEEVDESTSDVLFVTWPIIDGKKPTYCGVNRQTRKIASLGKGEKAITGEKLTAYLAEREAFMMREKEIAEGNYTNFIVQAKQSLTQSFKDPSSVQYRSLYISDGRLMALCGEVNAKNSYGAYVGFRRFYATGKQLLNAVEGPADSFVFERMWPGMCANKKADVE